MGKHYEQLTAEERASIMLMKASNWSARHMARTLRRSPSTITRALACVAALANQTAAVACAPAQYDTASLRARRARFKCHWRPKLAGDTVLFGVLQHFLVLGWSPSQIAGTLKRMWPHEP